MRILFIGDVVGGSGIKIIQKKINELRRDYAIDFCIANAENAAGGTGLTGSLAQTLYKAGVDCITLGNHAWSKWELTNWIDSDRAMVRPLNGGVNWPGKGYAIFKLPKFNILVIQVLGHVFIDSCESPFDILARELNDLKAQANTKVVIVDFHAEASAEKIALGYFLDGRVSAVLGTHTHVQTTDDRILPCGTGYITDVGMTGPADGVIGMRKETALRRFVDHLPARYELATGASMLQAVVLDVDTVTGRTTSIERIYVKE